MGIREMKKEDIEFAAALTAEEGWFYTPRELEVMLKLDPHGSYVFEDGERLGFVTTVTYGETGVLGHLVVSRKGRGRKIGGSLLATAMDHMEAKGAKSMLLYATPEAVKMYQKHGFEPRGDIYCVHLDLHKEHLRRVSPKCVPMNRKDLQEVSEMDSRVFGDDRRTLLAVLFDESQGLAFKMQRDGRIVGFSMARHDHIGYDLGPWACMSEDRADAEELFWAALSPMQEGTVYMGSFYSNPEALKIIEKVPKKRSWRIPLMIRGQSRYDKDMDRLFGIAAFELG